MASGSITATLRPLRLAFVVEPNDRGAILKAIQTATFLWGGGFDPIVPYYRRLPRGWAWHGRGAGVSARAVVEGYFEAFDPDLVVLVGDLEAEPLKFGHREVVKCSEVLGSALQDGKPNSGIGLFEVFNGFAEKELKYVRNQPIPFCVPNPQPRNAMFFASLFGSLPKALLKEFKRAFPQFPGVNVVGCEPTEYLSRLEQGTLSLRRLGVWGFETSRNRHTHPDCIFYMDGSRPADVIAFWNLRAVGWSLIPVCRRLAADPSVRKEVASFIDRNFFRLRGNPNFFNQPLLLPSRPELIPEATKYLQGLPLARDGGEHPWVLCPHYPRIWDAWAREKDGGVPCRLKATESETGIQWRGLSGSCHTAQERSATKGSPCDHSSLGSMRVRTGAAVSPGPM